MHPLYATAVGLLMNAIENKGKNPIYQEETRSEEELVLEGHPQDRITGRSKGDKKSVFDLWSEKLKDFLDNAE